MSSPEISFKTLSLRFSVDVSISSRKHAQYFDLCYRSSRDTGAAACLLDLEEQLKVTALNNSIAVNLKHEFDSGMGRHQMTVAHCH